MRTRERERMGAEAGDSETGLRCEAPFRVGVALRGVGVRRPASKCRPPCIPEIQLATSGPRPGRPRPAPTAPHAEGVGLFNLERAPAPAHCLSVLLEQRANALQALHDAVGVGLRLLLRTGGAANEALEVLNDQRALPRAHRRIIAAGGVVVGGHHAAFARFAEKSFSMSLAGNLTLCCVAPLRI